MTVSVTVFHAADCRLCAAALATVDAVCRDLALEVVHVDITGSAELEERYRASLPVVEIDGVRAFKFFVDEHDLRARLARRPAR